MRYQTLNLISVEIFITDKLTKLNFRAGDLVSASIEFIL